MTLNKKVKLNALQHRVYLIVGSSPLEKPSIPSRGKPDFTTIRFPFANLVAKPRN